MVAGLLGEYLAYAIGLRDVVACEKSDQSEQLPQR